MGGQRSMVLLIEHLNRRVVEPMVVCPGPGELADHLQTLDCPVAYIPLYHIKPRTLARVWGSSRRLRRLLRERQVDIVAPDASRDAVTCGLAKLGTPTKMVWFIRQTAHYALDPLLERLADGMIGDSNDAGRRFSRAARASGKFRAIWGGVDLHRFRPADDRTAARLALGLPSDRSLLTFVGQVKREKGVLDLVDAMGLLGRELPPERLPLLLVIGTPGPPTIVEEIRRRAAAGGVAGSVRMLPQQDNAHEWLRAADLLVSASHQDTEGMSRVLYEAMACGAVPIATDIRGNREAVTAETGVIVPERSPLDLARAVRSLLDDPVRLARMRAQAVQRARERFDIALHARGVERFYAEVLGRPS